MPIKRLQGAGRRGLPRLGKLRKGGEKSERGFGPDLTHFRFTSEKPEIAAAFAAAYGQTPTMLRVYLPYDTPERNFSAWQEAWGNGRLKHRCDGEYCVKWLADGGGYVVDYDMAERRPCPGGCREVGRLEVILPELLHAGFTGVVTLETHSINDIIHIEQVLYETYERAARNGNTLSGVEFTLRRVAEMISTPNGKGGRRQAEKWLVHLEPTAEWLAAQLEIAKSAALGQVVEGGANPATGEPGGGEGDEGDEYGEFIDQEDDEEEGPPLWEGRAAEASEAPTAQPARATPAPACEAAPQPTGKPAVTVPLQSGGPERLPAEAEQVREWLRKKAAGVHNGQVKAAQNLRGAMVGALHNLFPNDSKDVQTLKRRMVQEYVFGKPRSEDLTFGEVQALLGWAQIGPVGKKVVSPAAIIEAARLVEQAEADKGQMPLEMPAGEPPYAVDTVNAATRQALTGTQPEMPF
jgi:hypothetical protein